MFHENLGFIEIAAITLVPVTLSLLGSIFIISRDKLTKRKQ